MEQPLVGPPAHRKWSLMITPFHLSISFEHIANTNSLNSWPSIRYPQCPELGTKKNKIKTKTNSHRMSFRYVRECGIASIETIGEYFIFHPSSSRGNRLTTVNKSISDSYTFRFKPLRCINTAQRLMCGAIWWNVTRSACWCLRPDSAFVWSTPSIFKPKIRWYSWAHNRMLMPIQMTRFQTHVAHLYTFNIFVFIRSSAYSHRG